MKNNAFTLAEVLITLVLIGIIAALTIPSLIQITENQKRDAKLKKIYSTLNQAVERLNADNDSLIMDNPTFSNDLIRDKLLPYLNYIKKCSSLLPCFYSDNKMPYYANGDYSYQNTNLASSVVLADSVILGFYYADADCKLDLGFGPVICAAIDIDLDGVNKGPNKYAHDFFSFWLLKDKVVPWGIMGDTFGDSCNLGTLGDTGITCGYNILTNQKL